MWSSLGIVVSAGDASRYGSRKKLHDLSLWRKSASRDFERGVMVEPSPRPACGERSDRGAIRVRGLSASLVVVRAPSPPTLSPQAGRGRGGAMPRRLLESKSNALVFS